MFYISDAVAARSRGIRAFAALSVVVSMLAPQISLAALTPELAWIRQIGATAASTESARAVDDDGNTFIVGTTDGALSGETNAGGIDGWVRKYDRTGNLLFSEQFGTSGDDTVTAVSIDQSNAIYVIGHTTDVFPGETAVGGVDIFIRKYAPDLEEASTYVRQFGTAGDDYPLAADTDAVSTFIAGKTNGAFPDATNAGGFDAFAMRLDTDIHVYWAHQVGSDADDVAQSVDANESGDVVLAGTTEGTLPDQTSAGGSDAFWRLINVNSGTATFTQQFGTAGNDQGNGAALMGSELVVVVGATDGAFPGFTNEGGNDAFAKSFVLQSAFDWTTQFGTSGNDIATGIGHAISQRLAFVTGTTDGTFSGQASAGGTDVFLRKLDTWSGQTLWDTQFGTAFDDAGIAVTLDNSLQHVFATGYTLGTFSGQTSGGGQDGFVVKYKQDNDGDGIYNEVDVSPENFSDEFSDATLHNGITSGIVVDRADQNMVIEDDADDGNSETTQGVSIEAKTGGPATPAEVSVCQNLAQSLLDPGDAIDVTCGSAHIAVEKGVVDSTFVAPDGITTTTTFDAGNTLGFDGYSAFSAPAENADAITVNIGATAQVIGPGTTIRLAALTQDAFLREGKPNVNEGANPMLLVRKKGDVRSLVQFDLSSVNLASLSKATLVLSIGGTPPANWGGQGNPIEVRRLLAAWAEGNGKDWNIPEAEATRGSGTGVTWKCATDTAIENTEKDCTGNWEGGDANIASRTAPTVTVTNGMSGEVRFDVTQDVLNGATNGWLVQKVNQNHPGNITFYSKEGASGAPALAPKLILEFQE
jgi:hypothetical protein